VEISTSVPGWAFDQIVANSVAHVAHLELGWQLHCISPRNAAGTPIIVCKRLFCCCSEVSLLQLRSLTLYKDVRLYALQA
jgi:hypothetical protein